VIINFTPTGMVPTKELTPHVPIAVNEVIEEVHCAYELGITMVHLHARDEQTGQPTWKANVYAKLIGGIRRFAPQLVVCVSLSGRDWPEFEKRTEVLELDGDLKPDMGSLTLSSLNFSRSASLNAPDMVIALAHRMQEKGILPELEAFDLGMVNYIHYLEKKKAIQPPHYCNIILGNIASAQADLLHVATLIRDLPPNSLWSLGGIGDAQLPVTAVAVAIGGGVRVGLEDNIWLDKNRTVLARNSDLIERAHALARLHERSIMSAETLRQKLNLQDGLNGYGRATG
jgi:3-keto-5-aminohexanoate cleavage enzyme